MTGPSTSCTRVGAKTVRIEVVLPLHRRGINPGKQVSEDGTWVVKILCPTSPRAYVPNWPSQNHREVLAASSAERMHSVWARIDVDVDHIVAEALEKAVR